MLEDVIEETDVDFIVENTINKNFEIKFLAFRLLKIVDNEKLRSLKSISTEVENEKIFKYLQVI